MPITIEISQAELKENAYAYAAALNSLDVARAASSRADSELRAAREAETEAIRLVRDTLRRYMDSCSIRMCEVQSFFFGEGE